MGKKGKPTDNTTASPNETQLRNDIYRDLILKIVIPLFLISIAGIISTFFLFQGRIARLEGALVNCRCISGGDNGNDNDFPTNINVTIRNLKANQQVDPSFEIQGRASGDLKDHHLWVVIHPVKSNGWWPQTGEFHPDSSTGNWRVPLNFGGKKDVGKDFEVTIVLANKKANAHFNEYLRTNEVTHEYPPEPLPDGVRILKKMVVVRK